MFKVANCGSRANASQYNRFRSLSDTERPVLTPKKHGTYNRAARETVLFMKTNITLKIETDLLREARVLAAEQGTSISALLTSRLEQAVRERRGYEQARRRAVARLRRGFDLQWKPPASREELHER